MQRDRWPFIPTCLSEIIDNDRLAVIEAGCAERLGRAMTIIDGSPAQEALGRTDPLNQRQNFEAFCHLLRDETRVKGGNAACEECDQRMTKALLQRQEPMAYQEFQCHLGLADAAHLVEVAEQPVAVVFGGQFRPSQGHTFVQERVQQLGVGRFAHIQLLDEQVKPELLHHSSTLPPMPADFKQRLAREAAHIQRIAEAEHQRIKHQ
ncbi:MAG: PocR ligand-binding domain-containing protein [Caldilineaceae bacterium]